MFKYCDLKICLWIDVSQEHTTQGIIFIQFNGDSLYPFACWFPCLLIPTLIILMLIVYILGDRKLVNAFFLQKQLTKYNPPKNFFWKFEMMFYKIYINVLIFLCLHMHNPQLFCLRFQSSIQICKLCNALNANEECPWMFMRKRLLAMLILMVAILKQILMLLNLNTGYADSDLCIRILSLCYTLNRSW